MPIFFDAADTVAGSLGATADRIQYTALGTNQFTGVTGIANAHTTDSVVMGDLIINSGCPMCGTLRYNQPLEKGYDEDFH